jgi:tRNA-dihydrouridine synthase A
VTKFDRRVAVAPMMDWTDRHCRYFLRLLSRRALLYTEMVTTGALLRGDAARHLRHDPSEHPIALQLGGSEPQALAAAATLGAEAGYDEINLNCGCPSDRVQEGRFGACLMAEPELVAAGVAAMRAAVGPGIPVTVKTRIGIDDLDSYEHLTRFVRTVADAGCGVFIIHARKAWLAGLSPKENREIPPLRYEVAAAVKRDFPRLAVVLNGGIQTLAEAREHLRSFDGVMIGREAYHNPWMLARVDSTLFGEPDPLATRAEAIERYLGFVRDELAAGQPLSRMMRHTLGLWSGEPGARRWRRTLSERAPRAGAGIEVVREALAAVS